MASGGGRDFDIGDRYHDGAMASSSALALPRRITTGLLTGAALANAALTLSLPVSGVAVISALSVSLISNTAARADGGAGGQGAKEQFPGGPFIVSLGASGGSGFTGNSGANAAGCGGGGGGAAGGGIGGTGGNCGNSGGAGGAANGGNGGNGGAAGGGGGGGGANGINAATIANTSPLAGGNGGNGGTGIVVGGGGGGGAGGYGAVLTGAGANSNTDSIAGGTGGTGGNGANSTLNAGGSGGDGGVGVLFTTSGATFTNSGDVTGGNGGAQGGGQISLGSPGAGGAGIVGAGLTIINSGTITGGRSGNFATRANGITFTGGNNTLTFLNATTGITGNIDVTGQLTFSQTAGDVTVGNTITGPGNVIIDSAGRTVTFSAANFYAGTTTVTAGTLTISSTGSINSDVTNNANFNNDGVVYLTVTNSGTFANTANGTVSGLLTNTGGTATNAGQLNGGATVSGGTLTNNNLIAGTVDISGTGDVENFLTITGAVNNAATFNNKAAGTVSELLTNTAGTATNAGQLNGGATVSGGTLTNTGTITGAVSNAATFNNNAAGTVSGLLTNTAGTTTNVGQLNGGATVSGGTLTTTGVIAGGVTNSATVNANGGAVNGAVANNAGGTFNVGGTVTGDSTFGNANGATLAIGAAGNYTLQGLLTNSGAVTIASGGQLTATVAGITNNADGTITVAAGGSVADDLNNAGVVTNGGIYAANAINTGTINNDLTWTGTVSNAATFNNAAGATVSGLLTNTAGITTNDGALNGGATVSGGMLTGVGSVTNLTLTGGTFAPGSGTPGTSMTVSGSLVLSSAATYLVQLNPASSSFAAVTGTATLGGATVNAIYASGGYVAKKYTILTSGSISGTFGSVVNTNLPSGFKSTLSYDGTHAYLDLALLFIAPPTTGLSGNQSVVSNTLIDSFNRNGGIPLVFGGLTPGGLTQLSGETAVGSQQSTFTAMTQFMNVITDPSIHGRGDGGPATGGASQFAEQATAVRGKSERDAYAAVYGKAPQTADAFVQRWSVWGAGYGGSQTTDGSTAAGSNSATSRIYGAAVGADYRFSPSTLAGFALAGGATQFNVANGGSGRSDLFQAGAYLRHAVGPAYLSAALAYGWQNVTTDRTVTVTGDRLRANFNANAYSGRLEGGYRFVMPWMMGLTPYAAGQFTTFGLPTYAESVVSGTGIFALAYNGKSVTTSRSELGLRSDKSYAMADGIMTLRGRAAWAHDFNPDRSIASTFQALPGASFVVNGAGPARNAALTTASAEMKWQNGFSLAANFEGEFSAVTRSYAGKGVARFEW